MLILSTPKEYLFVGIDDYSRELYAVITPDKTQYSSEKFLDQMDRRMSIYHRTNIF